MSIGVTWNADSWRVPEPCKRYLKFVLAGYVRGGIQLRDIPSQLGDDFKLKNRSTHRCEVWWKDWHVGDLVEITSVVEQPVIAPQKQLPPAPQKQLPAPQKQFNPNPPGFGWDPGEGDD